MTADAAAVLVNVGHWVNKRVRRSVESRKQVESQVDLGWASGVDSSILFLALEA